MCCEIKINDICRNTLNALYKFETNGMFYGECFYKMFNLKCFKPSSACPLPYYSITLSNEGNII